MDAVPTPLSLKLVAALAVPPVIVAGLWLFAGVLAPGYRWAIAAAVAWFVVAGFGIGKLVKERPGLRPGVRATLFATVAIVAGWNVYTSTVATTVDEAIARGIPVSEIVPGAPSPTAGGKDALVAAVPPRDAEDAATAKRGGREPSAGRPGAASAPAAGSSVAAARTAKPKPASGARGRPAKTASTPPRGQAEAAAPASGSATVDSPGSPGRKGSSAAPPAASVGPTSPNTTSPAAAEPAPASSTPSPPASAPAGPVERAAGPVRPMGHSARGRAALVELPDGSRVVTLEDFEISPGPKVEVWLVAGPVDGDEDAKDPVNLGGLKGSRGNQQYDVPAGAKLPANLSVVFWCVPYSTVIAAADLRAS